MFLKVKVLLIAVLFSQLCYSQPSLPLFFTGTWKVENKESYEHWDRLNDQQLKGLSYTINNGQIKVSEYLSITQKNNQVIYTGTVINQNKGMGIDFVLHQNGNSYVFENKMHDFPKKIEYLKKSDTVIQVTVSGDTKTFSYNIYKQTTPKKNTDSTVANPNYDKQLAEKLGADDYGMKSFYLVILKTGTNITADKELSSTSFKSHFENMEKMVKSGHLIVAGPMGAANKNNYRGIFIINAASVSEVENLLQYDGAIKNKLLEPEIYKWYGSAALPEYLKASDKIWKKQP